MATLSIFAHTSDDDGSNFVNCENTRDPYGPKYFITAPTTFLFYALNRPADFNKFLTYWSPDNPGTAEPVPTQGGPKYTGAGRYAFAAASDPETFQVTMTPGQPGQQVVVLQNDTGPDYDALIVVTLGTDNSLTWSSPNADPSFAVEPGPPLGSGGGGTPDPDPIPVIPGDKELGWWVAPANNNNLDSNPGASYGAIVATSGVGEEARGWPSVYGGVVNPDRREVIWNVESWNPITPGTPAPNIEFPILLGTLKTPDGVKITNAEQNAQRRFGVLKLRATVGGVYAVNRLILAMSPGGLYGTTAFSTEAVPLGAKEFWTGFRNTFETV